MSGYPNWLQTHGDYINTVMEFAPKEYIESLDNCRKLINPTVENITNSLPPDWTIFTHKNFLDITTRFDYLTNKVLPINTINGFDIDVLGFIPLTHYIGDFLVEVTKTKSRYNYNLFTLAAELGMMEQDNELKVYGSYLLLRPAQLDFILENETIYPATRDVVNNMGFIRMGEFAQPDVICIFESKDHLMSLL